MDTKPNKIDYGVAFTKGIAGTFPFVGPLVAEAVGTFIPNQRLDRIAKFLEILDRKVADSDTFSHHRRQLKALGIGQAPLKPMVETIGC